jgi:hypothetical protein
MIFLTPVDCAYSRTCFIPLLADSTADLASSIVFPFTEAELATTSALTSIVQNERTERSIKERTSQTSKDVCQIVMFEIRDTYGFKSALVFKVCDAESGNILGFYCPKLVVLSAKLELCQ